MLLLICGVVNIYVACLYYFTSREICGVRIPCSGKGNIALHWRIFALFSRVLFATNIIALCRDVNIDTSSNNSRSNGIAAVAALAALDSDSNRNSLLAIDAAAAATTL